MILNIFLRAAKKLFISLFFFSALSIPFEQMVFAAQFSHRAATPAVNHTGFRAARPASTLAVMQSESITDQGGNNPGKPALSDVFKSSNPPGVPGTEFAATGNQGELVSTANNFNAWSASVDPRTGNASFSLVVASVLYDGGRAKRELTLSYSGSPSAKGVDSFDLGPHWRFNTGMEQSSGYETVGHKASNLTTGDDHQFTMRSDRNSQGNTIWRPLHHKMDDVAFLGQPGHWVISKATGIREHIVNGYEMMEETRDGKKLYFYYNTDNAYDKTRRLTYICGHQLTVKEQNGYHNACVNNGIWITYQGNSVTVHGNQEIILYKGSNAGIKNISAISMPSLSGQGVSNSRQKSIIRFSYDDKGKRPWLLSRVSYPTGQSKTFLYNEQSSHPGAQIKGLPVGMKTTHIPVVTEMITSSEATAVTRASIHREWYRYGTDDKRLGSHNYTGYQGDGSVKPGRDNLFDRPDNYEYSVSKDNGLTTTTTTYNKYHLPILVEQWDNRQKNLIAKHVQEYTPWKNTTFDQLPGNYSMPIGSNKLMYATTEAGQDRDVRPAQVIQETKYDGNGQKIWQKDAYGRITITQYCPPEGNERCPGVDKSWTQVTQPEHVVMIPASHSPKSRSPFMRFSEIHEDTDPEPVTFITFDYLKIPVIASSRLPVLNLMENNTASDVKADEHFLQVKTKTVGTLPLSTVRNLKPGDRLPGLSGGRISTRTSYQYDTSQNADTYGQLKQLKVIRYPQALPRVQGNRLMAAAVPQSPVPGEAVTIKVNHAIDKQANTRTTTMALTADSSSHVNYFTRTANYKGGHDDVFLGTAVYSLATGSRLISHDALKEAQTKWKYDDWGRQVEKTITPVRDGYPQTTRWNYIMGSRENAVITTLPSGQQVKKNFNSLNQLVSTWHRFADKKRAPMEGISYWIPDTYITYTETGKTASKTVYHAADPMKDGLPGKTTALTTIYGYDTLNRQVWKKTPDGVVSVTVRNDPAMQIISYKVATFPKEQLGPLLTVTESNLLGKPVARYLLPLDPHIKKRDQMLYSPGMQQQLRKVTANLQPASGLQTQNNYGLLPLSGSAGLIRFIKSAIDANVWLTRTTWEYDGDGRKIRQVQGNGAITRWIYQHGNPVATITPDGRIIHDKFNMQGKKISRCVQPKGSRICHVLGTREFDLQGNILWQKDEYGKILSYTWDENGRMLSMRTPTDNESPSGHIFNYQYNGLGLVKISIDGHTHVTHRYDPITWQLTDTNDTVSHLHYTYDENSGVMIKITRSAPVKKDGIMPVHGISYPESTQIFTQDRYLNPLGITDETGNKYTSTHDHLGRILQKKVHINTTTGAVSSTQMLTATTYDNFSRPVTVTNGQGINRLFSYNSLGQLASTTDTWHGRKLLKLNYTYDADTNNILTLTREEGGLSATHHYAYDLSDNLTEFHCRAANVDHSNGYRELCPRDIDFKNSGLSAPPVITDQKYTFDQWNNVSRVVETVSTENGPMTKIMSYNYAVKGSTAHPEAYDPNRLLGYQTKWQGQTHSSQPLMLVYDSNGRVIKDVDGNILHYNAFGQQDKFINAQTGEVTIYTYDSKGHQVAKQPFNSSNQPLQSPLYMLYRGNTVVAKAQRNKNNQLHISAELNRTAHSEDGVITHWYLRNYKGDVLQSYNSENKLSGSNVYSPYGMKYDRQNNRLSGIVQPLKNQLPWWQTHLPGFNGEVNDEATGYQFLGGGYRAYNPVYRHFMSRDSFSPFKKINGYGFVDNNPIMNTDPTGHAPKWLGYAMGALGIGMSIAMGVLLPVAGAAVAGSGVTLGAAVLGVAGAVTGAASGSLQIAATKHPDNMTLQKVSNGFGIAQGIAAIGMGVAGAAEGLAGIANTAGTITRMSSLMLIASGVSGAAAGLTGGAASGIGEAMAFDSRLASKSGLQSAAKYLGYISMGLMAVSMVSGGIAGAMIKSGKTAMGEEITFAGESEETGVDVGNEILPEEREMQPMKKAEQTAPESLRESFDSERRLTPSEGTDSHADAFMNELDENAQKIMSDSSLSSTQKKGQVYEQLKQAVEKINSYTGEQLDSMAGMAATYVDKLSGAATGTPPGGAPLSNFIKQLRAGVD